MAVCPAVVLPLSAGAIPSMNCRSSGTSAPGEMSLVGPRPLTRSEVCCYYGVYTHEILLRKPGLTGLWQVSGRSAVRFPERTALDLKLVRTLTPAVYLKILRRTIPALIHGRGAW